MKVLALDLSTSTGWAALEDGNLLDYGSFYIPIEDFNVNDRPEKSPLYPYNILHTAEQIAFKAMELLQKIRPNVVVVENTVKGRNRNTQRALEWIHLLIMDALRRHGYHAVYRDPSEWRSILKIKMTDEDKKNNKLVSQGKKRGKINKKHLAIRWVNARFNLALKVKDDDIADAIALGSSYFPTSN